MKVNREKRNIYSENKKRVKSIRNSKTEVKKIFAENLRRIKLIKYKEMEGNFKENEIKRT